MPTPRKPADDAIPVEQFATTASIAIPVASLLARKPELLTAALTVEQWQKLLDEDQATPTDPHLLPAEPDEQPTD